MTTRSIEDGGIEQHNSEGVEQEPTCPATAAFVTDVLANPQIKNVMIKHQALIDCAGEVIALMAHINMDDLSRDAATFDQKLEDVRLHAKAAQSESASDRTAWIQSLITGTSLSMAGVLALGKFKDLHARHQEWCALRDGAVNVIHTISMDYVGRLGTKIRVRPAEMFPFLAIPEEFSEARGQVDPFGGRYVLFRNALARAMSDIGEVQDIDEENRERDRLGLPPRVKPHNVTACRKRERKLITAVQSLRPVDVSKALHAGADPDTPHILEGIALTTAVYYGQLRIVRMLLAHGANPMLRSEGFTLLTLLAYRAKEHFDGGFEDREAMEDAMDIYIQIMGLLVRAGATAGQLNAEIHSNGRVIQPNRKEPDAWHWIRQVPPLYEAYLDAVEERKMIVEEMEHALAHVRLAVEDYPDQAKQAEADVQAMLDEVKRKARGR